jgi:hypothetical protein
LDGGFGHDLGLVIGGSQWKKVLIFPIGLMD